MNCRLKWILIALLCLPIMGRADDSGVEFFEKKIRPILLDECYQCHSQENEIKGDLRLDWKGGWLIGGKSGPPIIPGQVGKSLLIQAVRHTNSDLKMPPKKKLSQEQIIDLEHWIAMGAPDPRGSESISTEQKKLDLEASRKFWAFLPIKKHEPPQTNDTDWPLNNIDRFILAEQKQNEISPIGEAKSQTLLRRIHFDLTGLPPEAERIDEFLQEHSKNSQAAITDLIDELLSSDDFGIRWGRHWLDVVRYADSTGGGRTALLDQAWRYRDYVVNSFNKDKPFNQFIKEQIAGDLIQGVTHEEQKEGLIATGFLLLGPTNYELQDKTILEMDIIDEQLDTIGKSFLGLTLGCARCHDHKFDPISSADYYGMAGILKSTKSVIHSNVSTWNKRSLPLTAKEKELADKLKESIETKNKTINDLKTQLDGKTSKSVNIKSLVGIVIDNADAIKKGNWIKSTANNGYVSSNYIHDDNKDKGSKSVTYKVNIKKSGKYEVRASYTPGTNREKKTPITVKHAEGEDTLFINQTKAPPIDGTFISLGSYKFNEGTHETVIISNKKTSAVVIADAIQFLNENELPTEKQQSTEDQTKLRGTIKKLEDELKELQKKSPQSAKVIAVEDHKIPNDIHIAIRGNAHSKGEKTQRGFIEVISRGPKPTIEKSSSGRLQLADWIANKDNPLTARVFVNRVWSHLFHQGIVSSTDNFGHMGQPPTNSKLLDHLASAFIEDKWSVKSLIKRIMLSRTYQLSSETDSTNYVKDPANKSLWKQNSRRLEAEAIRDSILSISGELETTKGGPSIRPGTKTEYGYKFDTLRRSIYYPVLRNTLPEIMQVFDFADPNLVTGTRTTSSVPTQALFLMNNPFVHEQSTMAAKKLIDRALEKDHDKIEFAYKTSLGRKPSSREIEIIYNFIRTQENPLTAWTHVFHGLFSSIDFRHVN
jgi:hypothetical protein